MRTSSVPLVSLFALFALVLATSGCGRTEAEHPPNVLFIICDDLNDYPGPLEGHPQALTPNLDRLAESSVVFENAHSNVPVCAPSRNSLFTGIYAHRSGDFGWTPVHEQPVLQNSRTLMEYFRENGYHVMGSGKLLHHNRKNLWDEWGVDINNYGPFVFDGKELVGHPSVPEPFRSIGHVDGSFAPLSDVPRFPGEAEEDVPPGWVYSPQLDRLNYVNQNTRDPMPDEMHAEWAVEKLHQLEETEDPKPFFMAVGFVKPHTPLHAPRRFFEMYPLEDLELSPIREDDNQDCHYLDVYPPDRKGPRYYRLLKESYPDAETGLKHFLQAYLACISFVDEQIGRVLEALDQTRFRDNTIVIVTSDHGWQMGEKEYLFKNSAWEESTRIPLLIRAPEMAAPGSEVEHPVSLIDLYPTLRDLCGLEGDTRKNPDGLSLDGHSLRSFLESHPDEASWSGPDGALTMLGVGENQDDLRQQNYAYRTRHWRYIRYRNGLEELYDHREDPFEWNNLAEDPAFAEKKEELKAGMMRLLNIEEF